MARIMGLDYGGKRTGIAVTDPLQIVVNGLDTIETSQLKNFLNQYLKTENQQLITDNQIFMRIISMLINEAVEAKRLGIANDEDIETAMQKGVNYPKGLLNWGKEIGFSKISEVLQNLYEEYQEERYRQSPLLRKLN